MKNVLTTTALGMTLITGAWAFAGPLSVPDGALDVLPATPSAEGAQAFIVRAERDPDTAEEAQRGEDRRILINVPVRGDGLPPGEHTLRIDWQPLGNIRKADVLIEERGNPDGSSTRVFPVPAERGVIEIPLTIEDDGQPWRGRMRFRFEQAESAFEAGEVFGLDLHALQIGDAISFDFDGDSPETPEVKFNAGLAGQLTEVLPADEEERRAAGINVEVETGHPYNLVFPGDPAPRLVLTNNLGPIDGQVRWTVEGTLTGPQPPVTRPVKADVGEPIELEVVIPDTFDCYTVTAALLIDGQPPVELRPIPVARIEPHPVGERRATHDEFLFGVANGAAIGRNAEETVLYVELASTLGANYVRQTRKWPQIEPRPGEWNWKWMDAIVDSAEAHNIHVQTVVGKPATWAIRPENLDHPKKNRTTPQIDLYTSFLHTFVDRYGDRVRYYEVINEPDIGFYEGTVEEYLEVLRATHEVVSQRPGLVTMTGGFTGFVHGGRKRGFQETVLREAQDSFDLHTLHMHGVFPRFWNGLNDLVKRARDAAGVTEPMIFNETGMDTRFGPNHQAATLPKKVAAVRHHGAVGYVWFGLFD
ncbi:MAG: beta-galactosidase, partial [Planctomycetota bacterium]